MEKIIDGIKHAEILKDRLKEEVLNFKRKPCLAVISVGDNPATKIYVNKKAKCAEYIGIEYQHLHFDSITNAELEKEIIKLNENTNVDGIIIQLPLPEGLDENKIINTVDISKDVDGLTYYNAGKLLYGEDTFISCAPKGIMYLLKEEVGDLTGKNVAVVGSDILVGKPMMNLLIKANATVTLCHSKTKDLSELTKKADILVVAIDKKHFITEDMVKKDSIIIDFGMNRADGKLYGDVDFDEVYNKVKKITPVPGGVGPMAVVMLMDSVIESYKKRQNSF